MRKGSRIRSLSKNLILMVLSTSIFFLAVEMVFRVADLAPTRTLDYPDAETWAASPGPFRPDQDFVDRLNPGLPHRIRINSHGFRGPDFELRKAVGTYRILILGDSYVFGDYVNDDETFPASLERALREVSPGRPVHVVNAGVNGYTITDEIDLALEKGFDLDPDAVVVGFVLNDLADMTRAISTRENQRIEARRLSDSPLSPLKSVLRRTATYNLLFILKARLMGRMRMDPTVQEVPIRHLLEPPYDARTEELFERYGKELSRLEEACRARGARLLLVLFPFYEQVIGRASADAQERIRGIAEEAGVEVIDLLPDFLAAGAGAPGLFLMPLNHHPSPAGYRVASGSVARLLAPWLQASRGDPGAD